MLLGLTLLIAFFVAAELALVSADRHQIRQLAQLSDSPKTAKAAQLVHQAQNDIPYYSNRHIGEDINNFMNRADTRTASMV